MLMALVTARLLSLCSLSLSYVGSPIALSAILKCLLIFLVKSQGDLSMRVENHGNNEFGKLFNEMNKMKVSLSQMIASVKNAVKHH